MKLWIHWGLAILASVLAGCSDLNAVGVRPSKLPINVEAPCDHPLTVIKSVQGSTVGSDEIRMGRLGDALLECAEEKQVAVDAYNGVRNAVTGNQL